MASNSGVKSDALAVQGQNNAQSLGAYGTVNPVYSAFAQGNVGYTPQQMANANTSIQQSTGGNQAGAVGAGNLAAARTGNIGGYGAAIDDASRMAGVTGANDSLKVQMDSDQLAHQNQMIGLQGEQNIYDTSDRNQISALDAANGAAKPFWQQLLTQGISSAGQAGAAYLGK